MALNFQPPNLPRVPTTGETLANTIGQTISSLPQLYEEHKARKLEMSLKQAEMSQKQQQIELLKRQAEAEAQKSSALYGSGSGVSGSGVSGPSAPVAGVGGPSSILGDVQGETPEEKIYRMGTERYSALHKSDSKNGFLYVNPQNPEDISLVPKDGFVPVSTTAVNAQTNIDTLGVRRSAPGKQAALEIIKMIGKRVDDNGAFRSPDDAAMFTRVANYLNSDLQLTPEQDKGIVADMQNWLSKKGVGGGAGTHLGGGPGSKKGMAHSYKSKDEVAAAVSAGKLSREDAVKILKSDFGLK